MKPFPKVMRGTKSGVLVLMEKTDGINGTGIVIDSGKSDWITGDTEEIIITLENNNQPVQGVEYALR